VRISSQNPCLLTLHKSRHSRLQPPFFSPQLGVSVNSFTNFLLPFVALSLEFVFHFQVFSHDPVWNFFGSFSLTASVLRSCSFLMWARSPRSLTSTFVPSLFLCLPVSPGRFVMRWSTACCVFSPRRNCAFLGRPIVLSSVVCCFFPPSVWPGPWFFLFS